MTEKVTSWSEQVVREVQALLDDSLAAAGEVQRSFYGKPERRLSAADFLAAWNSIYMCAASTSGSGQWPHTAAIRLEFDASGRLPMLLYRGGSRERDLLANPRTALQKHRDDGTVLVVYATAQPSGAEPVVDHRGRGHVQVLLTPVRLYGMGPYVSGPLSESGGGRS